MEQYFSIRKFETGEVIFREGDPADALYIIFSGKVKVSKQLGGQEVWVSNLHQNAIFGELALVDSAARSATVTAVEPTECYVMKVADFSDKLQTLDPFMRRVFELLTTRLRQTTELYASAASETIL